MFTYAPKHPFKFALKQLGAALVCGTFLVSSAHIVEAADADFNPQQAGFYSDVFNENIYYEFADYLNFATLYRKVTRKKVSSANVNVYDEVADSSFYTNRHARKRLSAAELTQGAATGPAPDLSGSLQVLTAKTVGLNPVFWVRNKQGEVLQLKFDPPDNLELATSAEVIASRFYYAFGYNVSQSRIAYVEASQFVPQEGARFYDHTGFKNALTPEALEELLLFIPYADDGKLRVSVIKLPQGKVDGTFGLRGRDRSDPEDVILHQDRRELRALRVFSSWLNNYDVRRGNTARFVDLEKGQTAENTLLNYGASLGAGFHDAKPPMFAYEHLFDYGEALKAYFSGGFWEKPWQKKWREADEEAGSQAVGYFDNRYFDPGQFKTQLPSRAFKNLTNADAFWAAKTIMTFSDEDVRALVKAGQYSKPEDEKTITAVLIERRDLIGKYWFSRVNPLDGFDVAGDKLVFSDLAVQYGFEKSSDTVYRTEIHGIKENKKSLITVTESAENAVAIDKTWLETADQVSCEIQTFRQGKAQAGDAVTVAIGLDGIQSITH